MVDKTTNGTENILEYLALSTLFAVADLMITSAHTRADGFELAASKQQQHAPVELATVAQCVNEVLRTSAPASSSIGLSASNAKTSDIQKTVTRLEKIIEEQEKIIGEMAAGRPVVT